jgi:hypothetical protein
MGVDMGKCNKCGEVVHSDHIFAFDGCMEVIAEMINSEKIKNFLYEKNVVKFNKEIVEDKVKKMIKCTHLVCDYCINEKDLDIFRSVDVDFSSEEDFEKIENEEVLKKSYVFIEALLRYECKECNKEVKEKEAIENSKNLLQRLKAINKSKTKKEILDEIVDIIRAWIPLIEKPIINQML